MSEQHFGREVPRLWTRPLRELTPETSKGFEVIEFALFWLGVTLYPWQQWFLIHALELNEDGTYRFRKVFLLVGRQNGKTSIFEVLTLYWLFVEADAFPEVLPVHDFLVLGTAQNLDTAEDLWKAVVARIDPSPDPDMAHRIVPGLQELTRKPDRTNGQKAARLRNGASYEARAASRSAGRGKSAARIVMDEMREQTTWDVWGSVGKTKNAIFNSQLFGMSNAGDAKSVVLRSLRAGQLKAIEAWLEGIEQEGQPLDDFLRLHPDFDLTTALFEWSAKPIKDGGSDVLDLEGILQANPSVGHRPMFFDSIMSDLRGDEPEAVKRTEILCQWVDVVLEAFLDQNAWRDAMDAESEPAEETRIVLGVDVEWSRKSSAVAIAAYRSDGLVHVEAIAEREGSHWVVPFLEEVRTEWGLNEVALQTRGVPAAELVEALVKAEFVIHEVIGAALGAATGQMEDRLREERVRHRGQPNLTLAVGGAVTKELNGIQVWNGKDSPINTASIVAASAAAWALENTEGVEEFVSAYEDGGLLVLR